MEENKNPIVSIDLLESWKLEDAKLVTQEKAIRDKRIRLKRLIEAGTSLLSNPRGIMPSFRPCGRVYYKEWPATILKIAESHDRGISHGELKTAIMQTPLAAKLQESDNSYHSAIKNLVDQGRLFRAEGMLFSPIAYERYNNSMTEPPNENPTLEPLEQ